MSTAEPIQALVGELNYIKEYDQFNESVFKETFWHMNIKWGSPQLREYLGYNGDPVAWDKWKDRYATGYRVTTEQNENVIPNTIPDCVSIKDLTERKCKTCGHVKPASMFYRSSKGYSLGSCKHCYGVKYRNANGPAPYHYLEVQDPTTKATSCFEKNQTAADHLGTSRSNISRAVKCGGMCSGHYVKKIFIEGEV